MNISDIQGGRSPVPDDSTIENLEERIRTLCARVIDSVDESDLRIMCAELRAMLTDHIALVRSRIHIIKARELEFKNKK